MTEIVRHLHCIELIFWILRWDCMHLAASELMICAENIGDSLIVDDFNLYIKMVPTGSMTFWLFTCKNLLLFCRPSSLIHKAAARAWPRSVIHPPATRAGVVWQGLHGTHVHPSYVNIPASCWWLQGYKYLHNQWVMPMLSQKMSMQIMA